MTVYGRIYGATVERNGLRGGEGAMYAKGYVRDESGFILRETGEGSFEVDPIKTERRGLRDVTKESATSGHVTCQRIYRRAAERIYARLARVT